MLSHFMNMNNDYRDTSLDSRVDALLQQGRSQTLLLWNFRNSESPLNTVKILKSFARRFLQSLSGTAKHMSID